ncbi:MAG: tetratricopeptide repeat protein [Elusimicrobia bacterium]|nr:tetratricopeptide repeat protein [Elusimicrobiota bacterium]
MKSLVLILLLFWSPAQLRPSWAAVQPDWEHRQSAHFLLYYQKRDGILVEGSLEALESAYREIGNDLRYHPPDKIRVEIYRTKKEFALASTLGEKILEHAGVIGIYKFNRLMILTPEALAFGYRWQDALAHEYTHLLIDRISAGPDYGRGVPAQHAFGARPAAAVPLWLHEGISKYEETRWRLATPQPLSPGDSDELAQGLEASRLIPFSAMEPSLVYLDSQEAVSLAFAQVAHAVGTLVQTRGPASLSELLRNPSQRPAFTQDFYLEWKEALKENPPPRLPGAAKGRTHFKGETEEVFLGADLRGLIRLGDRFRQRKLPEIALREYRKALEREPYNPIALYKTAMTLLETRRKDIALEHLETSTRYNPHHAAGWILLADQYVTLKNWEKAIAAYTEALRINPFNPHPYRQLQVIHTRLGNKAEAEKQNQNLQRLQTEGP